MTAGSSATEVSLIHLEQKRTFSATLRGGDLPQFLNVHQIEGYFRRSITALGGVVDTLNITGVHFKELIPVPAASSSSGKLMSSAATFFLNLCTVTSLLLTLLLPFCKEREIEI